MRLWRHFIFSLPVFLRVPVPPCEISLSRPRDGRASKLATCFSFRSLCSFPQIGIGRASAVFPTIRPEADKLYFFFISYRNSVTMSYMHLTSMEVENYGKA
jgi:hypothetical protein